MLMTAKEMITNLVLPFISISLVFAIRHELKRIFC